MNELIEATDTDCLYTLLSICQSQQTTVAICTFNNRLYRGQIKLIPSSMIGLGSDMVKIEKEGCKDNYIWIRLSRIESVEF